MKAAIVTERGKMPVYGDFEEPVAGTDEALIAVSAAALNPLSKSRAAGAHYGASGRFPTAAGVDGVGRTEDGRRVYFVLPRAPFGSMAQRSVVKKDLCIPVPDKLDDVTAAAMANPGMSFWAALTERAQLKAGENVLINGATGIAGHLAIQIAKHLGAKKVIVTGRDQEKLKQLAHIGADAMIPLGTSSEELEAAAKAQFAGDGLDVVLDYLWGKSAEALIVAAAKAGRETELRFVQIGAMSGSDIQLPSQALRAIPLKLMGSGIGSVSTKALLSGIGELLQAAAEGKLRIEARAVPLANVAEEWGKESAARVVFTVA